MTRFIPLFVFISIFIFIAIFFFDFSPSIDDINFKKKNALQRFYQCYYTNNINDRNILKNCIDADKSELNEIINNYEDELIKKNIPITKEVFIKFNKLIDDIPRKNILINEYFIVDGEDIDDYGFKQFSLDLNSKISFRASLGMFSMREDENIINFDFSQNVYGYEELDQSFNTYSIDVDISNLQYDIKKIIEFCETLNNCKFNIFGKLKEKSAINGLVIADYIIVKKLPINDEIIKSFASSFAYWNMRSIITSNKEKKEEITKIGKKIFDEIYVN